MEITEGTCTSKKQVSESPKTPDMMSILEYTVCLLHVSQGLPVHFIRAYMYCSGTIFENYTYSISIVDLRIRKGRLEQIQT